MEVLWFLFGLGVGLLADFLLVLHMLKPIKKRISKLEIKTNINRLEAKDLPQDIVERLRYMEENGI
jgi:hypothetical protein